MCCIIIHADPGMTKIQVDVNLDSEKIRMRRELVPEEEEQVKAEKQKVRITHGGRHILYGLR